MNKLINSTDLHIQYRMETGEFFQWSSGSRYDHAGSGYHSTESYDRNYAKWLEEKLLEELQKKKDINELNQLLEYAEKELEDSAEAFNALEEKNYDLQSQIESMYED